VRVLVLIGTLVFIGIGVAGVWLADVFLGYPEGYAKPLILIIEAVLTLSVAVILGLLLAGPPVVDPAPGCDHERPDPVRLCAAALVGMGLYGLLCQPGALRKILAFNLIGSGVFLLFGVIARRGGGVLALAGGRR
jgi:hypothetical protein